MPESNTVGILMAGGTGSRLLPTTQAISKHLIPIYDKPTIYYSLSLMMLAEVRDVIIVCNQNDVKHYIALFGDGSQIGMNIVYEIQKKPKGIADAFLICRDYVLNRPSMLVLGDNLFFGANLTKKLKEARCNNHGATIFGYTVNDPRAFGVIEFNSDNKISSIEEKPAFPKSNVAVTGLYFYDTTAYDRAKILVASPRGELEISAINNSYLEDEQLSLIMLERGSAWLDVGTPSGLLQASQFVETIEKRQGFKIACLEEIAFKNGWITLADVVTAGENYKHTEYGQYLLGLPNAYQ